MLRGCIDGFFLALPDLLIRETPPFFNELAFNIREKYQILKLLHSAVLSLSVNVFEVVILLKDLDVALY